MNSYKCHQEAHVAVEATEDQDHDQPAEVAEDEHLVEADHRVAEDALSAELFKTIVVLWEIR